MLLGHLQLKPLTRHRRSELHRVVAETEGWLSPKVAELLYSLASLQAHKGHLVEIGSWQGKSTICLAMALKDQDSRFQLHAFDPQTGSVEHHFQEIHPPRQYSRLQENLRKFAVDQETNTYLLTSQQGLQQAPSPLSLVWLDGSHEYTDVLHDFEQWFPRLQPGGVMAFHDSNWPGVRQVLWQELFAHPLAGVIYRREQTTYVRKLERPNALIFRWNRWNLFWQKQRQALKRWQRRTRRRWRSSTSRG